MELGIDTNLALVYEGRVRWGHAISPAPIISPAVITTTGAESFDPCGVADLAEARYIFREDAYDPVSRVRRGRLYRKSDAAQPADWRVHPNLAVPNELDNVDRHGAIAKRLYTFVTFSILNELKRIGKDQPLLLLGTIQGFSVWSITGVEQTGMGDHLITLRARQSFGALPVIDRARIPEFGRDKVLAAIDGLLEDIYRAGAQSVIDRARDAASTILSVYLQQNGEAKPGLDLGKLIAVLSKPEEIQRKVVIDAADIIRIFHARGKSAEQERRAVRLVREQDAELAVQCVGTILCDLGWAEWR